MLKCSVIGVMGQGWKMATRRALFRCDGCEMELYMLAPVDRPCPACGGDFEEIEDEESEQNDLELGLPSLISPRNNEDGVIFQKNLYDSKINRIVNKEFEEGITQFENMLAKTARHQGWG